MPGAMCLSWVRGSVANYILETAQQQDIIHLSFDCREMFSEQIPTAGENTIQFAP